MKIITCTGYGNSGSSAATDFFSEFSNIQLVPHDFECTFIHEVDGLYDLEKAVEEGHRLKVDLAVKRFLLLARNLQTSQYFKFFNGEFLNITNEFVESAIGLKWNGWWHRIFDVTPLNRQKKIKLEEINKKLTNKWKGKEYALYENDLWRPSYLPYCEMYYEYNVEKFRIEAKKYINRLLGTFINAEKEYLLIDQLLPPIHPELYFHYFEDIYVIVVDRDPRDYYLLNNLFWGSRYIPSYNVTQFIDWYKGTRNMSITSDKVKRIFLEDFVYRYDQISKELITFVNEVEDQHTGKLTKLIPENSRKNTAICFKYNNFEDDIKIIEIELCEFLFDYKKNGINREQFVDDAKTIEEPLIKIISKYDAYFESNKRTVNFYFIYLKKVVIKLLRLIGIKS